MNCETWREMTNALRDFVDAGPKWPQLRELIVEKWQEVYRERAAHVLTCAHCIEREALETFYGTTRNDLIGGNHR